MADFQRNPEKSYRFNQIFHLIWRKCGGVQKHSAHASVPMAVTNKDRYRLPICVTVTYDILSQQLGHRI